MAHVSDLIETDIDAYLETHRKKSLLRFITCGSVDDGKSTLIGRLLYDSKMIFEDQLAALESDSKKMGTQGEGLDFALLVDGLAAEREQGITIDVAYRFFSTDKRKFIVADTPGHEQYTRNMVTGASTADLAVILIDARKGVLVQTRRHAYLCALIGVKRAVLAVNKMDMIGFDQEKFAAIVADFSAFADKIGLADFIAIPISGLQGDNVAEKSANTPWYTGPSLMEHLETVPVEADAVAAPFRMPVQWVNRPDSEFRGFSGQIAGGRISPGDAVRILPSGRTTEVARVVTYDGDLPEGRAGQSVTLTLADEVDCSRGDVIAAADRPPEIADRIEAMLVWMAETPLQVGRAYWLKIGAKTVSAQVEAIEHQVDVNTLNESPAASLSLNGIGKVRLGLDQAIAFDPYFLNRDTGGFILIDRFTNATVGAGMVRRALRRATDVHWQHLDIDKQSRAALKGQRPAVVWLTGLSGAGKSTIANLVEKKLSGLGRHTYLLDGDNLRHGLNKDLGFTDEDRHENLRRTAEVARLMADAGLIVIVSLISPFRADRDAARAMMGEGEFLEVFVQAPLSLVESRDPKGLYAKARAGEIKGFTGIDSPYEAPLNPDVVLDTDKLSATEAAEKLVGELEALGLLTAEEPDYEI
jgi:bifunctional enzyme CysN/CysC